MGFQVRVKLRQTYNLDVITTAQVLGSGGWRLFVHSTVVSGFCLCLHRMASYLVPAMLVPYRTPFIVTSNTEGVGASSAAVAFLSRDLRFVFVMWGHRVTCSTDLRKERKLGH